MFGITLMNRNRSYEYTHILFPGSTGIVSFFYVVHIYRGDTVQTSGMDHPSDRMALPPPKDPRSNAEIIAEYLEAYPDATKAELVYLLKSVEGDDDDDDEVAEIPPPPAPPTFGGAQQNYNNLQQPPPPIPNRSAQPVRPKGLYNVPPRGRSAMNQSRPAPVYQHRPQRPPPVHQQSSGRNSGLLRRPAIAPQQQRYLS